MITFSRRIRTKLLCSLRQSVELPSEDDGEDEEGEKGERSVCGRIGRDNIYGQDLSRPDHYAQPTEDLAKGLRPDHSHSEND